jgi:hypothetical protein
MSLEVTPVFPNLVVIAPPSKPTEVAVKPAQ